MNPPPSTLEISLLELLVSTRESDDPRARIRLNDLLRGTPAARAAMARLLVDEQALINQLRQESIVAMLEPQPRFITSPRVPTTQYRSLGKVPKVTRGWPSLAAAAVLLLSGYLGWRALRNPSATGVLSAIQPVAVLKEDVDAVWKDPAPRGSLVPGTLMLESGMAAIEFTSGARVLLEGPAELELVSDMKAFCRSGNLLVHVLPPAIGFSIATPSSRIVDLGTVFGLSVRNDGSTLVKVMQGEVELRHPREVYRIKTDAAAMIDPCGKPTQVKTPDEVFPSETKFNERIASGALRNAARWQATAETLAKDPAALLSYNFTESHHSSRSVRNHASGATLESHGTLVGVGWTRGRWPDKRALEFNGRSDRLLFKLSGSAPAATCIAWLRVDSLPNPYNIFLMPDTANKSALQWMLQKSGEMRLSLTNDLADPATANGWEPPVKAAAISNLDLGRWICLASTYDSSTGKVTHYRDGRAIGTGTFPLGLPVAFDSFSFGNWARSTVDNDVDAERFRNFVGCLDELAILSRALSPDEIEQFYQIGKP
jgi:hypothetical protein